MKNNQLNILLNKSERLSFIEFSIQIFILITNAIFYHINKYLYYLNYVNNKSGNIYISL